VEEALEAIVLGAGAGTRFGGGKLTAPWRGGRLIDGALAAAFAAPARRVTLVTGADRGLEAAAQAFAARRGEADRLRVIHAQAHREGMGASLRAGVASLPPDAAGAFVFLGDMPLVPPEILAKLAQALKAGAPAAAPVLGGRRGHPVLFSAGLFPELRALAGDEGARQVIARLGLALALVETADPGVLVDVDRPDDLAPLGD
jgi:molybdenum cofactor cytidylyltransferase